MKMKIKYEQAEKYLGWNRGTNTYNAKIEMNGKVFRKGLASTFATFLKRVNYIEVSTKPFEGSTELKASHGKYDDGFDFKLPSGRTIWACSEGLRSVGLPMSKLGKLYIKIR